MFLFNVYRFAVRFFQGSIDALDAATSFFLAVSNLSASVAIFVWEGCLQRRWRSVFAFHGLVAAAVLMRAALLLSRDVWAEPLTYIFFYVFFVVTIRFLWSYFDLSPKLLQSWIEVSGHHIA